MKKTLEYTTILLCLLPLFFINIKNSHDWGDDFAQYIHQAKNISQGLSQNETGYIFNENNFIGPQAYPTGFPLLLSPIVSMRGVDIKALNLLVTLFLALTCFTGFLILRDHFSFVTSFFTALIVAYNPVFLNFKTEILSDLPFAFFSTLCVYLMSKRTSVWLSVITGVLMGFTIHIRSVGILLAIVYALYKLFLESNIREFTFKKHLLTAVTLGCTLVIYALIALSFPCNSNYPSVFETSNFWNTINDHLSYNLHHLSWLFRGYMTTDYFYIGVIASSGLIIFSILGFLHFFRENKRSVINLYVLLYLFAVISYKFSHAGMRFLYPIFFYIFLYAIYGLKKSISPFVARPGLFALFTGIVVLFSYKDEWKRIAESTDSIYDGPQTEEAHSLFTYINTRLPKNSIVEFDKARALTLYSTVRSFAFYPAASDEMMQADLKRFKAEYILTSETQSTDNIKAFPAKNTNLCRLIYSNKAFKLYALSRGKDTLH